MRIHYTLEDNRINTGLSNPHKTGIIAEAKAKFDKLHAQLLLANLLRSNLVYQSYAPSKELREMNP